MDIQGRNRISIDFFKDEKSLDDFAQVNDLLIEVSASYINTEKSKDTFSEVIAIQRLISLSRQCGFVTARWDQEIAATVFESPNIFPLLAILLCLDDVQHEILSNEGKVSDIDVQSSRQKIYKHKLQTDYFSDTQILICADSRGYGRPKALYSEKAKKLISRADFESLVERLLAGQIALDVSSSKAIYFVQSIATIIAELFENTDLHGKLNLLGKPIKKNGIRGLILKRVKTSPTISKSDTYQEFRALENQNKKTKNSEFDAIEISIFDSGIGFYSSYLKRELNQEVALSDEWKIMHLCLARHSDNTTPDNRPSHRAMGLYEVLRALQAVNGLLEFRSGRTYGYRTFLKGDMKMQIESAASSSKPGMPKPILLDVARQISTSPTPHELLVGASVRVIIPLK